MRINADEVCCESAECIASGAHVAPVRQGRRTLIQLTVALMSTLPACMAFVAVRILMKIAPDMHKYAAYSRTVRARKRGSARVGRTFLAFFVACYRRSLFGWYLNRDDPRCCFIPSCTEYAERSVDKYGLWHGLLLTGDRFRRCRPSYPGSRIDFP
jgi:putative component of membrane protein insertase Oxa1/YidC/SpoIIIJ protein YidD